MTVGTLYDEIEFLTDSDSTSFPDADKLRGLNIDQGDAMAIMLSAKGYKKVNETEYYTDFISTSGLTAGQNGYNGEYAFDSNFIKITRAEVTFPNATEPLPCSIYDLSKNGYSEYNQNSIQDTFYETNPAIRMTRTTYFIRPLNTGATVANGIHLWVEKRQTDLTSESDNPILDPIFHRWYVLKQALRFGRFREGISRSDLEGELADYESKIKNFYKVIDKSLKTLNIRKINFR